MEMWKGIFVLFFFVSTTYTFQCDSLYSGRRCGEYDAASKSLKKVVEVTDDVISDAYNFIGSEVAELYRTVFPSLDNATIVVQGNMTVDEALALVNKLMKMLKELQEMSLVGSVELEKINQLITDALKSSLKPHPNAYLIFDKFDIEAIKEAVRNAIPSGMFTSIMRTVLVKAIDRAHGHLETIGGVIEPILKTFGYGDIYQIIKLKIQEIIQRAKDRAAGGLYAIENQKQAADNDVNTFLTGLDKQAPIVKRGIKDLWSKVEEALDKLGDNVKQQTKDLVEKYKPKVIDSLNRIKKVIIEGAKKIILELQGDIVKILTEDKKVNKRSITDIWAKVKEATKNLASNIKDKVTKAIEEHKPKVINALNNVKKVVIDGAKKIVIELNNGVVKILTDGQASTSDVKYNAYVIIDDSAVSQLYGFTDVWEKVKAELKRIGDKVKGTTKALIEKYKPKIVNTIGQIKQFVIDEGEKIIIELKGDLINIIIKEAITEAIGGGESATTVEKRSISDVWGKIKEAAKNLHGNIKDAVRKVIDEHKPKVIEALKNVHKVVIEGAKKIVISISNGVVKIVTEGQTGTSEGASLYLDDEVHTAYVVIDNSASTYGIRDVWTKVKQTVTGLGDKLSEKAKALIEKYKPKIVNSLNKVRQFVIDEGQKIILEIQGDIVRIIQSATDNLGNTITKRSISDVWGKIKEAAKNLHGNIKDAVRKVIDEHKPKVIEALKNVHKVVIEGAKKIVISISNGVVKIVTEGQTGTSEGASLYLDDEVHTAYVVIDNSASTYGIRDVWTKVKQTVTGLGDNLSAKAKALIEKYKPKIVNSLSKVRQFVIDEGQKIILEIKGDIVRIIQSATDKLGEKSVEKRSISDIWGKVKEAAKNLGSNIKDTVNGVLDQYKPRVINALNNVKKVVINGAKQIVIEINNGIVKIVTEGQTGSSDGAAFYYLDDDVHHDIYVEIDDASPAAYGIADAWTQVKSAVSDLGANVKDRVMKIIEEHKPKVVEALNNFQRVIIDAGKKIIIEVNGAIVKVIVDGLEGLSA